MAKTVLFPSPQARQALASRFGLPYDDAMQDWEWEVANAEDFDQYMAAYTSDMPAEQRFSLMEMLLQCVEDSQDESLFEARWSSVRSLLASHRALHTQTIAYWACSAESDVEQAFRVSGPMQAFLHASKPSGGLQ